MNKLLILLVLFPLACFAGDDAQQQKSLAFNDTCKNAGTSGEIQNDCLLEEKQKEAEANFQNFQENNHMDKTF